MLDIREVPGKGRGVFTIRDIKGGEVVLQEEPVLLYPQQGTSAAFCSHCLRAFNSLDSSAASVVTCSSCGRVGFCSAACAAAAAGDPGSHCAAVCRLLLACNAAGLTDEQQSALQFLARVCSLKLAAAAGDAASARRLAAIASLAAPAPLLPLECGPAGGADGPGAAANGPAAASDPSSTTNELVVRELHGRLSHGLAAVGAGPAAALTGDEVAELLRRDAANGYGIMAPSAPDGERRIRGSGIYAQASLINHECLPNVARFDCFDASSAQPGANAVVQFRALHDIPAGEELTQSYFPLPWPLSERQQRCQQDYGFLCTCPRCQEEATWSEGESEWETDEDAGMADAEGGTAAAAACGHSHAADHELEEASDAAAGDEAAEGSGVDSAYISLFLLKYVCPAEGCYGTLAPLPPGSGGSDEFECNMCGRRRTEADFLAELEAAQ